MTVNQSIFSPTGTIDASNANQVQKDLLSFIKQVSSSSIIINFNQVEFLDSAGLMALVAGYKEAQKLGKDFIIFGVSPSVRIVFEVSQLDQILGVRYELQLTDDYFSRPLVAA